MNSGLFAEVQELYDPTWTGVPLETRNPFLDRRLVRFLLRLPTIPWAMNKHLLRVTQAGILPDAILRRPKTPLQGDPLVLHVAAGNWNPAAVPEPQELLRQFVDWPLLMRQLENAKDTALYVHLRPVALSFWLKAIEKPQGIQ
jgi:asparagine synthase (glutamine-hydrolysing)